MTAPCNLISSPSDCIARRRSAFSPCANLILDQKRPIPCANCIAGIAHERAEAAVRKPVCAECGRRVPDAAVDVCRRCLVGARNRKAGATRATRSYCGNGHAYTQENTYIDPQGRRYCKTCKARASAKSARQMRGASRVMQSAQMSDGRGMSIGKRTDGPIGPAA